MPKNGQFWRVFEKLKFAVKQCYQTDRSLLIGQKLVESAKIEKLKMRHFWSFSNTVELKTSTLKVANYHA